MVKVWDVRALRDNRPVGIFVGHAEGISNVCSKGDGVYVASNCKDQLLKVWDIRRMVSFEEFRRVKPPQQQPDFDYRYGTPYRFVNRQPKHPSDTSLFTFKGHDVYQTLIRCQFSPLETTGQRYIYTGSSDGRIFIYDLVTGDTAGVLKKPQDTNYNDPWSRSRGGASPARDISWHPYLPVMAGTDFNGCVNMWTFQNISAEELLVQQRKDAEEEAKKQKEA